MRSASWAIAIAAIFRSILSTSVSRMITTGPDSEAALATCDTPCPVSRFLRRSDHPRIVQRRYGTNRGISNAWIARDAAPSVRELSIAFQFASVSCDHLSKLTMFLEAGNL